MFRCWIGALGYCCPVGRGGSMTQKSPVDGPKARTDDEALVSEVCRIIARIADHRYVRVPPEVALDHDLNLNSQETVELVVQVETHWGVELTDDENRPSNFDSVATFVGML